VAVGGGPHGKDRLTMRPDVYDIDFAVVLAPFDEVAPVAQNLFRYRRGRPLKTPMTLAERLRLRRAKIHRRVLHAERTMPILGLPNGTATALISDTAFTIPLGVSILLPKRDVVRFSALRETLKREGHFMSVHRAGRRLRRVEAHRGIEGTGWTWRDTGTAMDWETVDAYQNRRISQRLTYGAIMDYAARLGFDAEGWFAGHPQAGTRIARLRH